MARLLALTIVASSCALIAVGCSTASAPQAASTPDESPATSWLLTVSGTGRAESINGQRYLTLSKTSEALGFTSRPARSQIEMPASSIVALWQGFGFQSDPPNAAISNGESSQAVVLRNPALTANGSIRWLAPALQGPLGANTTVTIDGGVVNSQVTDTITETNVKALGTPAASAIGNDYDQATTTLRNATTEPTGAELQKLTLTSEETSAIARILQTTGGQGVPGANTPADLP